MIPSCMLSDACFHVYACISVRYANEAVREMNNDIRSANDVIMFALSSNAVGFRYDAVRCTTVLTVVLSGTRYIIMMP